MRIDIHLLESLVTDGVTDLFISARSGVWVCTKGVVTQRHTVCSESDVRELATQLIGLGGRHIDDAQPFADVALESGVRIHAVLRSVSVGGTEISVRVPRTAPYSLSDLASTGMLSAAQVAYLKACVDQRATVMVTGATGSGKSTLLAALMSEVARAERILTIEDVAELRITHPRVVSMETRQANVEGLGAVEVDALIRQALRMRPDRIVLGECRGREILDAFMAFNTGHEGGGTTLHANSLIDVPARLLSLLSLCGLSEDAATKVALAAIARVVHIEEEKGRRQVVIGRLARGQSVSGSGELTVEEIHVPSG